MKFSLSLPTIRHPELADPFKETFELARIAEEQGFDTATIGHHHFMPGNQSDPLTFMAAVAARTTTLRVGTGIFLLPGPQPRPRRRAGRDDRPDLGRPDLARGGHGLVAPRIPGAGLRLPRARRAHGRGAPDPASRLDEARRALRGPFLELSRRSRSTRGRCRRRIRRSGWRGSSTRRSSGRRGSGDAWLCGPGPVARPRQALPRRPTTRPAARIGRNPDWILRRYAWIGSGSQEDRRGDPAALCRRADGALARVGRGRDREGALRPDRCRART